MVILIKALQVILALSILILIHELGHFVFAKIFGIRVSKFYLFFDAGGFRLFKFKPKNSDTEYGIGWLPLGGYCKIEGMVDESLDTEGLKREPQPWEFRSKPAWQRLLVMAGGVLFNFIFAIIIYSVILAGWGEAYFSNKNQPIYTNELAQEMGFQDGDYIIQFDDYVPENFGMLQADLARNNVRKAKVLRDEDTINIYIDQNYIGDVLKTPGMFDLAIPFIIDSIPAVSLNYNKGLIKGDKIIAIEGTAVEFVQDSRPILAENKNSEVRATIVREDDTVEINMQVDSSGLFGVYTKFPPIERKKYSILSSIPAGFSKAFGTVSGYLKDLKLVFTPKTEAYKSVGSFIAMGQIFPGQWDWFVFLNLLATLSIMLGVLNLLPIPALDGGHIVFTLYEMITKKKPSVKFLTAMQLIGMFLLIALMLLALGNDISRII